MALTSPGVEVSVIDESFYVPAAGGSVPMIFVATAGNKPSGTGSGIAQGTLTANAGRPYLITSQRELGETFGDPLFYSDNAGNMIHGSELNEYGLQAAYSVLGVTNRAYVVRANIDLAKLQPRSTAPGGEPADGAHWFDTRVTSFGLLEWDGRPVTAPGGQSFSSVEPIILTQSGEVTSTFEPRASIGAIGEYAVVTVADSNQVWYKTPGNAPAATGPAGTWVRVGSEAWKASHAATRGDQSVTSLTGGDTFVIRVNSSDNTVTVPSGSPTINDLVTAFNSANSTSGIYAAYVDNAFEIYSTGEDFEIIAGTGTVLDDLGLYEGEYFAPSVHVAPHTNVPEFRDEDPQDNVAGAPSGSIWVKTTTPNGGADFRVKRYNEDTGLWETIPAPVYTTAYRALFELDRAGGGSNLQTGDLYVNANISEAASPLANFKIYSRVATGPTTVTGYKINTGTITSGTSRSFDMVESVAGSAQLSMPRTVQVDVNGDADDAEAIAAAINSTGFTNIIALVNAQNRVVLQHRLGGEIRIADTDGLLEEAGFEPSVADNLYEAPAGDTTHDFVASNWQPLEYTASDNEPLSLTQDGELWYNSIVDEVDILVHDGDTWVGYNNAFPNTRVEGPYVSATAPTGNNIVDNELWIDTSNIEEYPRIHRFNSNVGWILIDTSDQTTDQGILFADARWSDSGENANAASIEELTVSDYLDPDAPDPALYPRGMLLWNTRRSGFNVKRFVRNYVNQSNNNSRFNDEPMDTYYPHRWVTDSGNNEDGSGTFGRHAQRKSVIQQLQAMVNSNQEIRDDEARQFNLMACPGYPELIGEMVTLNYDRRLSAFVIGDTPARLTPDATSLNEWATNVRNAVEDSDQGAVSFDEYLGMYYPWGFTSDNAGNNVVVPPSHMALRTILLNDQVAFPWFAPAGTRRGGVTNATASGFITAEGEFQSVALNAGQRDVLYENSINPITFINGAGLVVFGQKTRARNASALDRVNVARLVVYLRGQLELLARPYLFEPNDKITRDQIKAAADSLLLELVGLRALYDFLVVCDESNNTPARIDRNELWLDIAIEPVKAIEFIYIPLRIKNTGEIASLG